MNYEGKLKLQKLKSFDGLDREKFRCLLEDAFGKKLSKGYFSYAKPKAIIVAKADEGYLGAIVVEKVTKNISYLDKIAVAKSHQGNGIGKKLWDALNGSSKKLVWRSKENNPINNFYLKNCEGMQKVCGWRIYWKGLYPEELELGIKYAVSKKKTMEEK